MTCNLRKGSKYPYFYDGPSKAGTTQQLNRKFDSLLSRRWILSRYPRSLETYPDSRECEVNGCQRIAHVRWKKGIRVCSMHYSRLNRNGTVDLPKPEDRREVKKGGERCEVDGCQHVAHVRRKKGIRVCSMHYGRLNRYGTVDLPKREPKSVACRCDVAPIVVADVVPAIASYPGNYLLGPKQVPLFI
jgi:hypothetical protein